MSVRIFTKDQARVFGETELGPQRAFHEELVIDITQVGPALDVATLAVPVRSVVAEAEQVRIDATPPADLTPSRWFASTMTCKE